MQFPKTWLDALRLRFLPTFLVDRWPIEYTTVLTKAGSLNYYWIFPEVPPHPDPRVKEFSIAYTAKRKE